MALRSDWSQRSCPVARSLDVVGDGWVLLIIRDVLHGNGRFDDLRENLGISEAVLSRRLRDMVDAGLLERVEYHDGSRARLGYAATAAAADLLPILQRLAIWGEEHLAMPAGGGHMVMIHEPCGEETVRAEVCSGCGELLDARDMTWEKPWIARSDRLVGPGVVHDKRPEGSEPAGRG